MKILFYGKLAEMIGREAEIDRASDVAALRARLVALHPHAAAELAPERARACVADTIVAEDFPLGVAGAVEFFPPLSGG